VTSKPLSEATTSRAEHEVESSPDDDSDSAFERLLAEAAAVPALGRVVAPGTRLSSGRFEILRRIGEGGMGVVYEAFDATRREKVALKTMSRLGARDIYQFKNEFRALCDVAHPNLVRLHELSADGDLWYFTMELVQGERFDHWVRPHVELGDGTRALHEPRLRKALGALVDAVTAIHASGKLHRDLKPSNVLVTPEGRVVVLDFGLAIAPEAGGVGQTVVDENVSGTPAYMAPEQAAGGGATAASDFYAVGAMVFEALTGRLPFEGRPHEILTDKQRADAPRASHFAPAVPSDLDELGRRLLAREPSTRPDAHELRSLFPPPAVDTQSSGSRGSVWSSSSAGRGAALSLQAAPELLGREDELGTLRAAFAATVAGQAVVVFLSGESGIGKSALCEAFLHELRSDCRATVLSGRCYERENVPFKGFDSLVDDLSRHLRKLPSNEAAAVLPREVYALTRLFPALGRVDVVAAAPTKDVADPIELRRRAYAAFGELLTRMRDRAPLCVHLDDLQWLDTDAVLFLCALLAHREPPPGLLLLSHRSENAGENPALSSVRDAVEGNSRLSLRTLSLGPLSEGAARALALSQLPGASSAPPSNAGASGDLGVLVAAVARESAGSPFFVGELCRFAARHAADVSALEHLSLESALVDHLTPLSPAARRLLEVSALAGKPLPAELLLEAARATHTELDQLRSSHLVRLSRVEGNPSVECYHDKVRETVAGAVTALRRVGNFAALADALDAAAHPDPELLATCFEGAGQRAKAGEQCAVAAERAMGGTAFLRAAELYAQALALGDFAPERAHALRVAQADALAAAGRGKLAAEAFRLAAKGVAGVANRELRRRAATELSTTGHFEEGLGLFREIFHELGLTLPASPSAALRRLLWSGLRLRLRGLEPGLREAGSCPPEALHALTAQRAALPGVALLGSPILSASLSADYLLGALAAGEPHHVAGALTIAAFHLATVDPTARERIAHMTAVARRIIEASGDPWLATFMERMTGHICVAQGLFARARGHLTRAIELHTWKPDCWGGDRWELDTALVNDQMAAFFCGDWLHIGRTTPSLVEQSYGRDSLLQGVTLSGSFGSVAWLSGDDGPGYERTLERAKARWPRRDEPGMPDFLLMVGETMLWLYRGEPERASQVIEGSWAWLSRSLVNRSPLFFAPLLAARAGVALACLRATERAEYLSTLRDSLKRLGRCKLPYVPAYVSALRAGLALHEGNRGLGAESLRAAVAGLDTNAMTMHAAAARRRLGELLGGEEGKALVAEGDAAMRAQRVTDLDAITELLCAGCRAP
jgi:hypothetical protein